MRVVFRACAMTPATYDMKSKHALTRRFGFAFVCALALVACAESDDDNEGTTEGPHVLDDPDEPFVRFEPRHGTLVSEPETALPELLSDVGIYGDLTDLRVIVATAFAYEPYAPLWSNGLEKQRFLIVPEGEAIDNSNPRFWIVPEGTLLFKTFWVPDSSQEDGMRPIETRLMRRNEGGWDYVSYRWRDDRRDADLLDMRRPVDVSIALEDGEFIVHTIPNRLECRKCHESAYSEVLGLSEIQLAWTDGEPRLRWLDDAGWLTRGIPDEPYTLTHSDPQTLEVLRYFEGNCVTCHNGSQGASSSFDMRSEGVFENLINRETESSATAAGIRVIPGDPENSILYQAIIAEDDTGDVKRMPPIGVQVIDSAGTALIYAWIASLAAAE